MVLADAAYGTEADWRDQLSEWGLTYAVGVRENTTVWYGSHRSPRPRRGQISGTRPASNAPGGQRAPPAAVGVGGGASECPPRSFRTVTWREGTNSPLRSRFCALRVRAAHDLRARAEQWLLIEWPKTRAQTRALLVVHSARRHSNEEPGGYRHGSLAHRAGLSGTEIRARLAPL